MTGSTNGDSVGIWFVPCLQSPVRLYNGTAGNSISNLAYTAPWGQLTAVTALYNSLRPVSACLDFEFVGPTTADGGYWDAALLPRNVTLPVTVNLVEGNVPNISTAGFSSRSGRVLWRPQDDEDNNFVAPAASLNTLYPSMLVCATGLPSSATYIRYRATVNFEGIPMTEATNLVTTSPSPMDLSAYQSAINAIVNMNPISFSKGISMLSSAIGGAQRVVELGGQFNRLRNTSRQLRLEL